MDKTSLGDRMKMYENIPRMHLTPRMPLIIRIDGRAFHSYTKGLSLFDENMRNAMIQSAQALVKEIQGAKVVYMQSDELSVLINDYEMFNTQSWFGKNLQKIVSVSSSIVTAYFNKYMWFGPESSKLAMFDSRAFVIPREDACNYFCWRQQDAERNSIASLAQANFSYHALFKKTGKDMKQMLLDEKNIDWNLLPTPQKRGWCVLYDGTIDLEIPRFQENREYIDVHLKHIEE